MSHRCLLLCLMAFVECLFRVHAMAVVPSNRSVQIELDTALEHMAPFRYELIPPPEQTQTPQFLQLPSAFELSSFVSSYVSVDCFNHTVLFLQEVQHLKPWALEMLDASAKIPSRVLMGNLNFWGSYSECVDIKVSLRDTLDSTTESAFTGQYCSVSLTFDEQVENASALIKKFVHVMTRNVPKMQGVPPQLVVGLCVPSSCSSEDVLTNVQHVLRHLSNSTALEQAAAVQSCQTKDSVALDTAAITVIAIWSAFAALILVASVYEIIDHIIEKLLQSKIELHESRDALAPDEPRSQTKSHRKGAQLLLCFSVVSNTKKIVAINKSAQNLFMLEGMRFLSMSWIILGHTYFLGIMTNGLWDNVGDFLNVTKVFLFQTVIKGIFAVDTFLFLSGLLLVYVGLRKIRDSTNTFSYFGYMLLHRFIRIAPLYYMLIAWVAGPSDYFLQGGSQWPQVVQYKKDCGLTWWKSALYISNFGDTTHMCAPHSWYISLDTQLYIVGCILLIFLQRWRNIGIFLIVLCILASCSTAFVISYLEHIPSSSLFLSVPAPQLMAYSTDFYIKPYCRMGPYGIGMLMGYLLLHGDQFKTRIKPLSALTLWIIAAAVNLTVIYGTYSQFLSPDEPTALQGSLYNALAGTAWSLGLGWMVYACYVGYGGFVSSFLSFSLWIPLSRLTYGAYLLHYVIEYTFYERQESKFHFDQLFMVMLFLGFLVLTFLLAFLFSLAFEVPFINMERLLTSSQKKAPKQQKQQNIES